VPVSAGRPFRFGVNASNTVDCDAWQTAARKVEDLGYSTFVIQDHFGKQFAPLPALMAAAAVTSRLRLGTIVLDNDFRHPAVLAKDAATIDVFSNGRLELGLGAGWLPADYQKSGIPFGTAGERLERLEESVQVLKALFEQESVSFSGKHYQVQELETSPRPVQRPHPPIMIGGRQRRMLAVAGRHADIVSISLLDRMAPNSCPPPTFAQKLGWVREAAGERFNQVEIHVNVGAVEVTNDVTGALERIATRQHLTPDEVRQSPGTLVGSVDGIVERLHQLREQYAISYFVINVANLDAFAPVVARAVGH
jgi:probable F420-dependent oxidoreductase